MSTSTMGGTEIYSLQAREVLQEESNVQPVVCVICLIPGGGGDSVD